MNVQLMAPVSVVLVIDSADIDSFFREHVPHRLARHHRELHELDRLLARKTRAVFDRNLRVDDHVPAVAPRDVRMFKRDYIKMRGFEYDDHGRSRSFEFSVVALVIGAGAAW